MDAAAHFLRRARGRGLGRPLFRTALGFVCTVVAVSASRADDPAGVVELGTRRELFVDRHLIDQMEGTELRLQQPRPAGSILKIERPWEGNHNFGTGVFRHDGRYYLYYRAMPGREFGKHYSAVAVSDDGVTWTKPNLGLVTFNGSTDNNLVALEDSDGKLQPARLNLDFWLDTNPAAPAAERWKLMTYDTNGGPHDPGPRSGPDAVHRATCWVSADGFRFRKREVQPQLTSKLKNSFDSFNVYFWSDVEKQYLAYYRWYDSRRTVARITSNDLVTWTEPVPMTYGDTPREHLYTNATAEYFRAPHLYVAFPARFMEGRKGTMTDEQYRGLEISDFYKERAKTFNNSPADGAFMTSRAGSAKYDRTFMESFVRPGTGLENWVNRGNYPLRGLVQTGPAEMSLYVMRHYMQDSWHIERLTLRLDGFASLHAPYRGGEMLTKPFTFGGSKLTLNYATSVAGVVQVEIQDADGKPISEFVAKSCDPVVGDEISRVVTWGGKSDLSGLAGKAIRLRFILRDADVYSLRFE
jgi:hypothetical protein